MKLKEKIKSTERGGTARLGGGRKVFFQKKTLSYSVDTVEDAAAPQTETP